MPSKLFCVVLLVAGCKEKAPPKQEPAATQPSPDPSPAARKPELPKPDPVPEKGSGDGSGGAKPTAGDGPIGRKNADVEAAMAPPGKLTEKLKQRAAERKAAEANKK